MLTEPLYVSIKKYLYNMIRIHEYDYNYLLPSEQQLCIRFKCSRVTAKRALNDLEAEGKIIRKQGRGSFINVLENSSDTAHIKKSVCVFLPNIKNDFTRALCEGIYKVLTKENIKFFFTFTEDNELYELSFLDAALGKLFDGIIFYPAIKKSINSKLADILTQKKFLLYMMSEAPTDKISSVCGCDIEIIRLALNKFITEQHKHIGFISDISTYRKCFRIRIDEFNKYIDSADLSGSICEVDYYNGNNHDDIKERIESFLQSNTSLSALITNSQDINLEIITDYLMTHNTDIKSLVIIDAPNRHMTSKLQNLKNIKSICYIDQSPKEIGEIAGRQICSQILSGNKVEKIVKNPKMKKL